MVAERLAGVPGIITLAAVLVLGLVGAMAGRAPLIDTKLLGRPPKFEDIGNWKQWRFQVLAYFGALEPELCEELQLAETATTSIDFGDLTQARQARSRVVFYVLSQLLHKAPLQVLMSISENNGYEAWRVLKRDYEPDSGSRHVAMLSNILRPTFDGSLVEFWEKLRRWINDVETYEASSGEDLADNMKVALVIQAAPREIREKLQLQDFTSFNNLRGRIEHYIHTTRVWANNSASDPTPMDIGAVGQLSRSKYKGDKGSGKQPKGGKPQDGGKGGKGGKPQKPPPFEGYCNGCGKWGHKKSERWSESTKNPKGKADGKGKGGRRQVGHVDGAEQRWSGGGSRRGLLVVAPGGVANAKLARRVCLRCLAPGA